MRGQAGFFDVGERLKELSAKGDALERLSAVVDFDLFRADLVFDRPACVAVLLPHLAGFFAHSNGMRPSLISRFSPSVLRCFGAATIVASMLWPPIARNPAAERRAAKRLNRTSIAGVPLSASRKVQIVFASGTVSASLSPRKRMNDRRSRIRLSVRS